MREPVDAVITWVDGNDKSHADKIADYLARMGIVDKTEGSAPTRFNQCGEINYCIKSLLRFAPWIRTIYIVTDAQPPPILKEFIGTPQQETIKLIDHRDIFYGHEDCLPTFNSLTIESMIWRIKDLSNQFIYLNDDCAIVRPVAYEDFFRDNKIIFRGHWRIQSDRKLSHYFRRSMNKICNKAIDPTQDQFRAIQENSAKLAGWHKYFFQFPHAPLPLKRDTFEEYFLKHRAMWSRNLHYPLRDQQQFWPLSLIGHEEINQKNVIFDNSLRAIMVNGACHNLKKIQTRLGQATNKKNVAFVCLQSVDQAPSEIQEEMMGWLNRNIIEG